MGLIQSCDSQCGAMNRAEVVKDDARRVVISQLLVP